METTYAVLAFTFPCLVLIAALSDATTMTIPNWISVCMLAAFLALAPFLLPWSSVLAHAGVGAAALLIGIGLFAAGWIGGGDAKLCSACALWVGWTGVGAFLLVTAVAGGALALMILLWRKFAFQTAADAWAPGWLARLAQPNVGVPYGIAIAAGALFVFPASPIGQALGMTSLY